jgi:hypothetical protein
LGLVVIVPGLAVLTSFGTGPFVVVEVEGVRDLRMGIERALFRGRGRLFAVVDLDVVILIEGRVER